MKPVRPAQRLERLPELHDDADEGDEEDESDVSTEVESEVLSQQFRSLPWPFPAVNLSVGISPSASMRRGISPLASDHQTCMSASSLTAWSGAQVVYGGGTGTGWASGLGLNKFDKLRASPRSSAAAASKGVSTTTTAPTAAVRPITATTTATTAPATKATSLQCELTAENLDRLRDARGLLDELPVGPWKENTPTTRVSPPAVIAVSPARGNYAAGVGGTRVSRAAALSKQQPVPTWHSRQRGVNYSTAHGSTDLHAHASATATAAEDDALNASVDGPREKQSAAAGATPATSSTPPLAAGQGARSHGDESLTPSSGKEDDDGRRGAAGGAGGASTTSPQRSSAAAALAGASARASYARNKGGNGRAPFKRQRLSAAKTRYQGQILQLEDCTETAAPALVSSQSRERAPRAARPADVTAAGPTPSATCDLAAGIRVPLASASAGAKKSAPVSPSLNMPSVRGVDAARRIPATGPVAHDGTLLPSSTPPTGREADQEGREAARRANRSSSAELEDDQAASGINGFLTSFSVHTLSPENARQLIVRLPASPQIHPTVPSPASEKARCGRRRSDLVGADQGEGEAAYNGGGAGGEAGEGVKGYGGVPPTPALTHQGRSSLMSSSAVTSSRPPLLSLTAIGVSSATSGVFRSATQTSPRLSAALQRITLPHQPQQQVRPAVIISTGTTEPPPSRKPLTAVTVTSPSDTGDSHISVSQASRADPSRRSAVRTGASKASSSCETHMPSSVDCLPSVGSTQPPLSLRTPDGGGGLRWRLTTSSRTSSAGASDQHARSGRPRSTDSASSDSTAAMLHEVWAPAVVADHSSAATPSTRSELKPPATFLSLDGQAGATRLNSHHVGSSDVATASNDAAALIPAVLSAGPIPAACARRSDNAEKQQTGETAPAAVAPATSSHAGIGVGSDGKGRDSSVQATTRVRRTPTAGRQPSGGDRISFADRRALQPVRHGSATSTSPEESGAVVCAVRDRPRALAPLDGRAGHPPSQAAVAAGGGTDAAGLSVKTDPAAFSRAAAVTLDNDSAQQMPDMWQQTLSRVPVPTDRRSTAVVLPSQSGNSAGDGLPAAGARGCSGITRPRSRSLPAGALPSAGGTAAQSETDLLSPKKSSTRLDEAAARQRLRHQPDQPEPLPRAVAGGGGGSSHEESHRTLHIPATFYSNSLNSHACKAPATNTVASGDVPGQLSVPPSMRCIGDSSCILEKGAGRPPNRLPMLGLSSSGAAANSARPRSPKDADTIGGHGNPARVSVARRKTMEAIRESPLVRSRSGTSSNGSGSNTDDSHHPNHPQHQDRLIMPPDTVAPPEYSQDDDAEESEERPKRTHARKVPPPRRRRCADVRLPEDGEERTAL
ncbi:hypothetical protein GH5_07584 [Leishmania sp. Ghana 2012 LV757]|uniref:hypothetical protein n=1 Tax=Leishmania sp. Ghana 2012 LV757 TaxID=2803181 RepID=UPI001B62E0C9|nr:hypothetical protein GH5_07584 [Leishmania sp. Ghana 2012 LV757]